jgi:hypothetical protein
MDDSQNPPELRLTDIQYLPHHRCPSCQAPARTTKSGAWLTPYQDWFGSPLRYWQDHLGYVNFKCICQHHSELSEGLRVARLGDAILPVHFVPWNAALNAQRIQQAVQFLAAHADPSFTAESDWLAHTLHALAAGGLSPAAARRQLEAWVNTQVRLALEGAPGELSPAELVNLEISG